MPKYKTIIAMRAIFVDEVEVDNEDDLVDYLWSQDYELPEFPESWDNYEILSVEEV